MNDLLDVSDVYSPSNLFSGIMKDKQVDIFNEGQRRLIPPGETLFCEGDAAFRCYFVQNGRLKLSKLHEEGKEAILRIMRQSGRKIDTGILIDFKLSRQDLADYTGTTLYTVSRILSNWENRGWIESRRERIVVTDAHAMVTFAEAG